MVTLVLSVYLLANDPRRAKSCLPGQGSRKKQQTPCVYVMPCIICLCFIVIVFLTICCLLSLFSLLWQEDGSYSFDVLIDSIDFDIDMDWLIQFILILILIWIDWFVWLIWINSIDCLIWCNRLMLIITFKWIDWFDWLIDPLDVGIDFTLSLREVFMRMDRRDAFCWCTVFVSSLTSFHSAPSIQTDLRV